MVTKKTEKKNAKYSCYFCDFFTSDKNNFSRHKMTRKHLKLANGNKKTEFVENVCNLCGKNYKHRSGLSRHKKKCELIFKKSVDFEDFQEKKTMVTKKTEKKSSKKVQKNQKNGQKNLKAIKKPKKTSKKNQENIEEKNQENIEEKDEIYWKKQVEKSMKQQYELKVKLMESELRHKNEIIKMKDEVINIVNNSNITNTTNNYNNCNNKNLIVNLFLNENCKNAMNLTDFVDKIKVQLEDVLYQKVHGCTLGLTNILTKELQEMNPLDRPIHCSDEKKLHFYIKEDDKWSIDDNEREMEKSLRKIQVKQIEAMKEWEEAHPNFENNDKLLEERNKLMAEILNGCEDQNAMDKNVKEIKKNVAKLLSIQELMDNQNKK